MCLIVSTDTAIKVAERDIICYKVFEKQDEDLISPYQRMHYKCGTTYESETPTIVLETPVKHTLAIRPCIEKGFHSFIMKKEAKDFASLLQAQICNIRDFDLYSIMVGCLLPKVAVIKCLIPKETRYAEGYFLEFGKSFESFCSERIIAVEEV